MLLEEDTKNKLREQLECLELYLTAKKNVDVIFGRDEDNAFYNEQGYITINTRQNLRSQLHSLFHEAGHVLLRSDRKIFNKKYPGLLKRKDSKSFFRKVSKGRI